jgi:hypothetical protein
VPFGSSFGRSFEGSVTMFFGIASGVAPVAFGVEFLSVD